ncbi:aminopeptidase P N-terminal domain-containing protein [Flammeovirgaceae bacterium SG7u.111]|nr:aminopeptidase P N-terminal domain-containing protein [Flammeovirgaceae bacterium SG7u.132]WPO35379.1 aminopeptidase P N-terminal domain-containing protein [Flammeovirgaceae bacterium SG7u.111]
MKYAPIDNSLFIKNRKNLAKEMKPNSIAILNSNDIMPTSADGVMPFKQHSDIFYLSGINQEESVLVVFPDAREEKHREILFLKETSELIAIWEGAKYTKQQARETSGVPTVYWLSSMNDVLTRLVYEAERIYLNTNEHLRAGEDVETRDARFIKWCKEKFPLHEYERLSPIMHHLRVIKSETEVELIKHACGITKKGFERVLKFVKPGVWEYEIEAEMMHEFLRNRSRGSAYEPIIASGSDSCVLHYISNAKQCQDGDVLLMDFGAEYANYASDLTRTIPVSGKFTERQKAVYNAVLRVMKQGIQMLVPGNNLIDYTADVQKIMEEELIELGLFTAEDVKNQKRGKPLFRKYFMHGVSHHLGLDVHDYGSRARKFEDGMVFTCEPGIYIREEGIGVRIENDILINGNSPVDLMADIPIEADEIESIMQNS